MFSIFTYGWGIMFMFACCSQYRRHVYCNNEQHAFFFMKLYWYTVHTQKRKTKKDPNQSKQTCLQMRLHQLTAKILIASHISFLDKIHLLSLLYQSLHAIKSRINWYTRTRSSVSVLQQYCLTTALTSTIPARNSLTVKLYRTEQVLTFLSNSEVL